MQMRQDDRVVVDAMNRPRVRDAVKASLFGYGGSSWMSQRRRRILQVSLPVAGFLIGMGLARLVDRLPDGSMGVHEWSIVLAMFVVGAALYYVYDVLVGLEMLEKRAVQADLDLARQIQRRMLPDSLPAPEGWELASLFESARSIGGDAYDARLLDDGRLLVAVADVAGKGAAAALLSSGVLARLRALARTGMDVDELTVRLSAALVEETEPQHFSTLVVGELDPVSGEFVYVNAGNAPPLLVRADGSVVELETGGMPVGMLPEAEYEESRIELQPGDRLIIATDGLFDADATGANLLSEEEVGERVHAGRDRSLEEVVADLGQEVRRRSGKARFDDVTVLAIGRKR